MNCYKCEFYKTGYNYNACMLTGSEYFYTLDNCTLVNEDGTINYKDEYFSNLVVENDGVNSPFESNEVDK